ncbi:MAG TPA: AMP-binding protein [Mycobacteriales bacterium]|nr:AMP-binding protein [Mycobacteriales bacterium]
MATPDEPQVSFAENIRTLGRERTDQVATIHVAADGTEQAHTYGWLDRRSTEIAHWLAGRGLAQGDRLALRLRNSPELIACAFAAWKLGVVPVPVRWDIPDWELERVLDVIEPKVHLAESDLDAIRATDGTDASELPDAVAPHMHGICSSGSTGTPKVIVAALPSLHNPVFSTPMAEQWFPVPRPQTVLVLAPMYHVNAFATLQMLMAGDRLVVMQKFDGARALELVEKHRISTFTATPTMLQRMADSPGADDRDLSSIVWINQGAAPMPPSLVHRWAKLIDPMRLVMAYGMTEGLGITALTGAEWMEHEGSVGRGQRGTEVRILDTDGTELPAGEIGDIYLRSPSYGGSILIGNQAKPKATEDGFVTVGDMGYLDSDGYLFIIDRRVDMIISGGANVFPAEVETALIDHPQIADVVVIGLKDPEWGRRVHAIIEPADPADPPSAEAVIAYAKSKILPYKVPKTVEIVEAIPRSAATKVNRGRLIEEREG